LDRYDLVLDRVKDAAGNNVTLSRLVITTDAGMGKTVNMKWLFAFFNQPHGRTVAFWVPLGGSMPVTGEQLTQDVLVEQLCLGKGNEQVRNQAARAIRRLRVQGRLVLLFDALDQASGDDTAAKLLRNLVGDPGWHACRIVLSGRPHALQRYWTELFADQSTDWRYVQVDEFNEEQQRQFLGEDEDGRERFDRLPEDACEVLSVPRVLEYLILMPSADWGKIRKVSDVYWQAMQYLVSWGMNNSAEARRLGLLAGEVIPNQVNDRQLSRAFRMLGAIAFQMTSTRMAPSAGEEEAVLHKARVPNFDRISQKKLSSFLEKVTAKLAKKPRKDLSEADKRLFERDFDCLAAMNDVLAQGVLDAARQNIGGLKQILWRDRSLQEFFTAYWLATHGTRKLGGELWDWIYRPWEALSEEYYWVWRFLAEMPEEAIAEPRAWVRAIEPIYRPGNGCAKDTRRSSEMIYRSWRQLNAYATAGERVARKVRDRFLGEFDRILAGKWQHKPRKGRKRAEEFRRSLMAVPAGTFHMGAPAEKRAWPNEVPNEAYREPAVGEFLLSHSPTVNAWYCLYDPSHGVGISDDTGFSHTDETPAVYVSWYDAWAFCLWVHWDGQSCRLPEEHEWEYAAKAGTPWDWDYWWGDDFDKTKCNSDFDVGHATPPAEQHANSWGFRDILGNVWEWCSNAYQPMYQATPPEERSTRVCRGGSWIYEPKTCRSAYRTVRQAWHRGSDLGFRVARALE
jgi:formylglycine-generating enzyme required for sulfatase activity